MFNKLKEKAGYVSVETIVIAGIILVLGVVIISKLFLSGKEITARSEDMIYEAYSKYQDPDYTPIIDEPDYWN